MADIDIARLAKMAPIDSIAAKLGIDGDDIEQYGKHKAKISLDVCARAADNKPGKLILVTAISPTPAGEGKTTTTIGLVDGLNRIGKRASVCIREPSLGPCFGMKGGAAGGGYAQVVPMEDINLHFTGDMHAIGAAHNLLAAALDNHMHHSNSLRIDPRRITWPRVVDMNDRALRNVVIGLGGPGNSFPRESSYQITVASEVMAIFCLSSSLTELRERLGNMIVGYTRQQEPITASQINVHGAMTVLLKDALQPNLVQTLENNPAFVHGGPFANIAHGCNSVIATNLARKLSEYTVTEAGFAADLGAEKFFDIKCRQSGIRPDAVVVVATIRALKYHGGVELPDLQKPDVEAVGRGTENLKKHIENVRKFGLPVVVAVNAFTSDSDEEFQQVRDKCDHLGVEVVRADHWARGGEGAADLAKAVVDTAENHHSDFKLLYPDEMPLFEKIQTIVREVYGGDEVEADKKLLAKIQGLQDAGYGNLPICMAKTQYSFSTDPGLRGRPKGFNVPLRDVTLSAGAGFLVVLAGDVMTMPGLPKVPSAEAIDINDDGEVVGLF